MESNRKIKHNGYPKEVIDILTGNGFQKTCRVSLQRLTEEDITRYTSPSTDAKSKKKTPIIEDPSKVKDSTSTAVPLNMDSITTTITPSISISDGDGSLQSETAVNTSQPQIQAMQSTSTFNFPRTEGNITNNVVASPVVQLQSVTAQISTTRAEAIKRYALTCYGIDCGEVPKIFCSSCKFTQYCSHHCLRYHWYQSHKDQCDRLKKLRKLRLRKLKRRGINSL